MNTQSLLDTAGALIADDKGLLAMDESNLTFASSGELQSHRAQRGLHKYDGS